MSQKEEDHFLELYKLYVEMTDRVSERRLQTNKFYMTLLSSLLLILSFSFNKFHQELVGPYQSALFIAIGLLGSLVCLTWYFSIRSYRQVNSKKFEVIHEMERELPYPLYAREWKLLGEGKDAKKYFQLTRIEKYVPFILTLPYLILVILGLLK